MNSFFSKHKTIDNLEIYKYSKTNDKRGSLFTIFLGNFFKKQKFNHDKVTYAIKNSLRGMHGDNKTTKLITCIHGKVYCNIYNDDPKSKFYKKKYSFRLNQNFSILIPPKVLLGWCVLSKEAILIYKFSYLGKYNDFDTQKTVRYDDPRLKLKWPIKEKDMIVSKRDKLVK